MIYVAVNRKIAQIDLNRALKFRIEANTIDEMISKLNRRTNGNWTDFVIFSVD